MEISREEIIKSIYKTYKEVNDILTEDLQSATKIMLSTGGDLMVPRSKGWMYIYDSIKWILDNGYHKHLFEIDLKTCFMITMMLLSFKNDGIQVNHIEACDTLVTVILTTLN